MDGDVRFAAAVVHRTCRREVALLHHRPVGLVLADIGVLAPADVDVARLPAVRVQ